MDRGILMLFMITVGAVTLAASTLLGIGIGKLIHFCDTTERPTKRRSF